MTVVFFKPCWREDFFYPFNYPRLQSPVCVVFYIDSNSVIRRDSTYCLLAWLSSMITCAPTLYVPIPHHQYAEGMTQEMEVDREELCCFESSHITVTWRLLPERKAGEKVGCAGKVRISLGENVQQLKLGLSPALAQPPLCIVVYTKPSLLSTLYYTLLSGPLHIQKWNVH